MSKTPPGLAHSFPFDPTYGYKLAELLRVPAPEEPEDFATFWKETYEETRQLPLKIACREITCPRRDYQLFEIEYDSLGGVRIGGWITVPKKSPIAQGGWVVGHGYGGREAASFSLPVNAPALYFCARGFHRSVHPDIPDTADLHVIHGIEHRDRSVLRGCVADVWCAASALAEIFPESAAELRYSGGSFGGGLGALALPWDKRFHKAFLEVPTFGHHPLRLQLPCVGSGEALRRYKTRHPAITEVLAYYDAACAARHINIPVLVAAALFDPAVPPPGQFAIYNSLPGEKELFVRTAAHFSSRFEVPESRALLTRLTDWFSRGQDRATTATK